MYCYCTFCDKKCKQLGIRDFQNKILVNYIILYLYKILKLMMRKTIETMSIVYTQNVAVAYQPHFMAF